MTESKREQACVAAPIPASMSAELDGYEWARDKVGASGASVYRLHGKHYSPDLFLKHGENAIADNITDEMTRLRWLARHIPVPAVAQFVRTSVDILPSVNEGDSYRAVRLFCTVASAGSWAERLTALLVSPEALISA